MIDRPEHITTPMQRFMDAARRLFSVSATTPRVETTGGQHDASPAGADEPEELE